MFYYWKVHDQEFMESMRSKVRWVPFSGVVSNWFRIRSSCMKVYVWWSILKNLPRQYGPSVIRLSCTIFRSSFLRGQSGDSGVVSLTSFFYFLRFWSFILVFSFLNVTCTLRLEMSVLPCNVINVVFGGVETSLKGGCVNPVSY